MKNQKLHQKSRKSDHKLFYPRHPNEKPKTPTPKKQNLRKSSVPQQTYGKKTKELFNTQSPSKFENLKHL